MAAPPTQQLDEEITPRGSIAQSNDEYMEGSEIEFGREDIENDL